MLREISQILAWLIGSALGLAVLFYLVLLAINWRDASPSEDAIRFAKMYANRPIVPDEQNAFIYMVGMSVDTAHDPMLAGMAMVNKAKNNSAVMGEKEYYHPDYPQVEFKKVRSEAVQEFIDACKSIDKKCLTLIKGISRHGIQHDPFTVMLVERYRNLIKLRSWQDIYPGGLSGPIPPFGPVFNGHALSLLDVWQQADTRGAKTTIAMLDEDAFFWRKVLISSDSLITSMVAARALKINMLWTNLVMLRLSEKAAPLEVPANWNQPFSDEERLMQRAWVGELALSEPMLRSWSEQIWKGQESTSHGNSTGADIVSGLISPFYQSQDSINRHATDLAVQVNEYSVNYEQLPEVIKKREGILGRAYDEVIATPRVLYNPVGKLLFYFTLWPDKGHYMLNVSDLEGCRRALLATIQLRVAKTPHDKITEALAVSPYRNPYTGQPFIWDDSSGSVVFEGLGEGKWKHLGFLY